MALWSKCQSWKRDNAKRYRLFEVPKKPEMGFDANPTDGQDLLDLTALGITVDTFAVGVAITDLGPDTLITVGTDTITLKGVNGVGANAITRQDFLLL